MRVADYFAQFLAERGVAAAFMVSGGQMMHLIDAVGRVPSIRYFCNHHEQASAMAADAYARMTGLPGLCYATGGPGGTNLLTGLVGAYQDSIPVVFLTGQCKVRDTMRGSHVPGLRQHGPLEADIEKIVRSVTKYAAFVWTADSARWHMEKAYHLATTGRPGPVLLDIPLDIQGAQIDPNALNSFDARREACPPLESVTDDVLSRLMGAERPLILAGHGIRCSGMVATFSTIMHRLNVPAITTQLAKDLLSHAHPLFVGHPGIKGDDAANAAVREADVILILGSSLHIQNIGWEPELFAPNARKIHVDPDSAVLAKTRPIVTSQYCASMQHFLPALLARLQKREESPERHAAWRKRCAAWKEDAHKRAFVGDGPADLYEVVDVLSDAIPDNAVILTDAGQPYYLIPQILRLKAGQRYLVPGSLAEMGWALPASLGVAAAEPGRPIVAIIGDGSLQTNIQELQTVKHHNIDLKLIVINNDGYASIRSTQNRFFDGFHVGSTRESGVTLPDLEKIAVVYGVAYSRSPDRTFLHEDFARLFKTSGPIICEIMAKRDQEVRSSL